MITVKRRENWCSGGPAFFSATNMIQNFRMTNGGKKG